MTNTDTHVSEKELTLKICGQKDCSEWGITGIIEEPKKYNMNSLIIEVNFNKIRQK
jgi:hypothetical protein